MATATTFLDIYSRSDFSTSCCLATFSGQTSTKSRSFSTSFRAVSRTDNGRSSSTSRYGTRKTASKTIREDDEDADDEGNGTLNFGTQLFNLSTIRGGTKSNDKNLKLTKFPKKDLSLSMGLLLRAPDTKTVFVAGATGQIGARVSQQLLRNGFSVRGGVRDLSLAQQLAEFATQYGVISREEARKINAVEFDFGDVESIARAIGNAGRVVVTVGAGEDGPESKVTPSDALQVVEAASLAKVSHVVVVSEAAGGVSSNGPLALISDFFSKLFTKPAEVTSDSLLDSVVDTDLRFTFIKVSSTEGVNDFSPEGNSVLLMSEGTYNRGTSKVSKSQLASVVAGVLSNVSLAENKVLEVASINSESPKTIEELLSSIPVDGRRAALAEARAKAEAEENERRIKEAAEAEARRAIEEAKQTANVAKQLEEEAKKLAVDEARASLSAQKAKDRAKAAAASLEGLGAKMKEFGVSLSEQNVVGGGFGNFFKRVSSEASSRPGEEDVVAEEEPAEEQQKGLKLDFGFFKRRGSSDSSEKKLASSPTKVPVKKGRSEQKRGMFKQQEPLYADD